MSAILLLGAYLSVSPGADMFLYPKLVAVFLGASLCLRGPRRDAPLRKWVMLTLAVAMLSGIASASPMQAAIGFYPSPTAGLLGMAAAWLSYEAGLRQTADSWGLIAIGAAVCSIMALLMMLPAAPWHSLLPSGRAIGTIGSPPFLGCMLALAIPVALARAPMALLAIVPALLATRSKAAIIGAVVGIAVAQGLSRRAWLAGGGLAVIATVLMLNRGMSDTMRIYTWGIAWKAFLAHPWLGWGPEQFIDAFIQLRGPSWIEAAGHAGMTVPENAHNLVLNTLATQGVLGMGARVALGAVAWRGLANQAPESVWNHEERGVLLASGAAVLVYSMFNPVPFMAWCLLGFMAGTLGI